jgi:chromosomal replication initiation ATPase DnaA
VTSSLNPRFTFETFVVGPANRLAVSAARTAAENPGASYNPLFIYSASGLGKTHLITAIGARARALAPELRVEYLTLEEFRTLTRRSRRARRRPQAVHRRDVVLIDDVQFPAQRSRRRGLLRRFASARAGAPGRARERPPAPRDRAVRRTPHLQFAGGRWISRPRVREPLAILRSKADERVISSRPCRCGGRAEARNVRELLVCSIA